MQEGSSMKAYDSFFLFLHSCAISWCYFTLNLELHLLQRLCLQKIWLFPALNNSQLIWKGLLLILHLSNAEVLLISCRSIRIKAEPVHLNSLLQESSSPCLLKSLPVKKKVCKFIFYNLYMQINKGHSGSMATACPKGRDVHQAERWRVQFPLLQLPEGCTHGFAMGEPLSSLIRERGLKKMAQGLGAMNTLWALGSPKGAVSCAVGDWVLWGPFRWTAYLTSWLARLSSQWGCVMGCWWLSSMRSPWVDSIPNELMGLAQFLACKRDWKDRAQ